MVCGVVVTGWGWLVATDFRGLVTRLKRVLDPGPRRNPRWSFGKPRRTRLSFMPAPVGYYRAIGGVFVLGGPIMFIVGAVDVILG